MRAADQDARGKREEQRRRALLDAWPLPPQGVPEADEPLDRSAEGDDEPITEKVPVPVAPAREPERRSKR
jgi:hypothetical protein